MKGVGATRESPLRYPTFYLGQSAINLLFSFEGPRVRQRARARCFVLYSLKREGGQR